MILILHIIIALSSLSYTGYTLYKPSQTKLRVSYGLVGLTVVSGVYLVLATQSSMLHACAMGLTFVFISLVGTVLAQHRLTAASVRIRSN